jgi:GNAT superfamily N-acetyltransferase
MNLLDKSRYADAFEVYRRGEAFFPLIGAVLLDEQDGLVYADDVASPRQWYVEHHFGFAQSFGVSNSEFESDLQRYLLVDRRFSVAKVRLYTPLLPKCFCEPSCDPLRSIRQRVVLAQGAMGPEGTDHHDRESILVDDGNVAEIDRLFGIVGRFWRSRDEFVRKANAVVTLHRGTIAAICYAAAEADRRVEIDVFTLPEHRAHGVGRYTVRRFVERCLNRSLQPLWDCFTNNVGSMQLCRSAGFTAERPPYPFFTINQHPG